MLCIRGINFHLKFDNCVILTLQAAIHIFIHCLKPLLLWILFLYTQPVYTLPTG